MISAFRIAPSSVLCFAYTAKTKQTISLPLLILGLTLLMIAVIVSAFACLELIKHSFEILTFLVVDILAVFKKR